MSVEKISWVVYTQNGFHGDGTRSEFDNQRMAIRFARMVAADDDSPRVGVFVSHPGGMVVLTDW